MGNSCACQKRKNWKNQGDVKKNFMDQNFEYPQVISKTNVHRSQEGQREAPKKIDQENLSTGGSERDFFSDDYREEPSEASRNLRIGQDFILGNPKLSMLFQQKDSKTKTIEFDEMIKNLNNSFQRQRFVSGENQASICSDLISYYHQKYQCCDETIEKTQFFVEKIQSVKLIQNSRPQLHFDLKKVLGSGGFCKVMLAKSKHSKDWIYAVRFISKANKKTIQLMKKQIYIMELCKSKYTLEHNFTHLSNGSLYMFVEYMDKGSLTDFIKYHRKKLSQKTIAYIIKKILMGLRTIHSHNIVHRDIKSQNILINSEGKIKIADFGNSTYLMQNKKEKSNLSGTIPWMAPEVIKKEYYNEKVDIWSLGIVLYELCMGPTPYDDFTIPVIMCKIVHEAPPKIPKASAQLADFLSHCLTQDPQQRWSCEKLLKHPFVTCIGVGINERDQIKTAINYKTHKKA